MKATWSAAADFLEKRLGLPPATWPRALPYLVVVVLTALQGKFGEGSAYWIYLFKTLIGAGLVCWAWRRAPELRPAWSWAGVLVGTIVFALWVGLDPWYPKLAENSGGWNPFAVYGQSALAWFFAGVRILGSALVIPFIEEPFFRSFLYRFLQKEQFEKVALREWSWTAFLAASAIFGLAHREWLAGILCGAAYQALVCRKGRLGDAILAHGATNLLLGLWVVREGAWQFW